MTASGSRTATHPPAELVALLGVGPVSAGWLAAAGITTVAQLRRIGAVEAFRRVAIHQQGRVSMNLLYGLEGALRGVRWDRLPADVRQSLRAQVEGNR